MVDLGKFQQIQAFDLVFEYEVLPTLEDAQAATTPVYGQAWQYKIEGSMIRAAGTCYGITRLILIFKRTVW